MNKNNLLFDILQVGERIRVILDCEGHTLSFERNYEFLGVAFRGKFMLRNLFSFQLTDFHCNTDLVSNGFQLLNVNSQLNIEIYNTMSGVTFLLVLHSLWPAHCYFRFSTCYVIGSVLYTDLLGLKL